MTVQNKARRVFLWCHAAALCLIPLFFLYRFALTLLPAGMSGCLLHDYLFLYCPLCGGTRAVEALLHLDFLLALRYNAFVVCVILALLVADVIAWVRFFRRRAPLFRVRGWVWIAGAIALVLFGILRNYLMIAHGIDPTGDLGRLWQALTMITGRISQ